MFWLNIQLSKTKINIYEKIKGNYKKYELKRDQVLFSLIKNNYNIKKIKIKDVHTGRPPFYNLDNKNLDLDYGYIKYWSDIFSRPFGGHHF